MHFKAYKAILSSSNGMNIYRGCTHGCIYCDSRSDCYQMDHQFEDVEVKTDAHLLLEQTLKRRHKKAMIMTGSMSDPYIPLEKDLQYTRQCLQVIEKTGFGLAILTKSDLILRDLDLLVKINQQAKCIVQMTLTTYDEDLCKKLEPNVCSTQSRYEVLQVMREHQIETVVWLGPLLPMINDTLDNLKGILDYCIKAQVKGIICFGIGMTLRPGNREYYYQQLDRLFPGLKAKYIKQYGNAYQCGSDNHPELIQYFRETCQQHGIMYDVNEIFAYMSKFETSNAFEQLELL